MLTMEGVSTSYGKIPMLHKIDIKVDKGEVVCILGANGAGKTTILKTIISLVKPDQGRVSFKSQYIETLPTHKIIPMGIAVVQPEAMFPKMTVEKNLKMGLYFEKDPKIFNERLEDIFRTFPVLKERLNQHAGTLSGGERSMLAIGRGLISHPDLLLMDEPSLGLSPLLVEQTFEMIKRINREREITILLVEQNANQALSTSSRGYVLQKGEIIFEGSREKLMENKIVKECYLEV